MRAFLGSIISLVLVVFVLVAPASGSAAPAAPSAAPTQPGVTAMPWTPARTNQEAWVRGCAQSNCGYHAVSAGKLVLVVCWTENEGLRWNLITTPAPWNPSVLITGFTAQYALTATTSQGCFNVGEGGEGFRVPETWAHSCTAASCGFGVMPPNHNVAGICKTYVGERSAPWILVLDHDNRFRDLVGFIPKYDYPREAPAAPC